MQENLVSKIQEEKPDLFKENILEQKIQDFSDSNVQLVSDLLDSDPKQKKAPFISNHSLLDNGNIFLSFFTDTYKDNKLEVEINIEEICPPDILLEDFRAQILGDMGHLQDTWKRETLLLQSGNVDLDIIYIKGNFPALLLADIKIADTLPEEERVKIQNWWNNLQPEQRILSPYTCWPHALEEKNTLKELVDSGQAQKLTFDEGLEYFAHTIEEHNTCNEAPYHLTITARSGTGKSLFSDLLINKLRKDYENDGLVHTTDHYYLGRAHNEEHNVSFDHVEAIWLDKYNEHTKELLEFKTIERPIYCMNAQRMLEETKKVKIEHPDNILLQEGIFTLHTDSTPNATAKMFNCTVQAAYQRLKREMERAPDVAIYDVIEYMLKAEELYGKQTALKNENVTHIIENVTPRKV